MNHPQPGLMKLSLGMVFAELGLLVDGTATAVLFFLAAVGWTVNGVITLWSGARR